jgi:hypothetical protein
MASVVSAAVVSGELIIGLDDGSIIRAGYVQGPQGLTGPQGPMGATGSRGTDGNTIHTVGGTPRNDIGTDGDYAIDNINWRIYGPKSGGTWGKAKEMLPGKEMILENGRMTAMTGGGGGGGGLGPSGDNRPPLYDGTDNPPTFYPGLPPSDPGYNLHTGDMWIDSNGSLHIYYTGKWNKVTVYADQVLPGDDAPYLIVTPNGETFVHQKQYNEWIYTRTDRRPIISSAPPTVHPDFPAYPLREGDYWIDDNSRLYYWNGSGWAPVEGGGGRHPIFDPNEPTEHPDYSAPDNVLEIGDIWYDTDDNFKQYIWDGSNWVAVTPDRFEAFTRVYEAVSPASYNSGNDGTCALTATGATIDTITNIKLAGTDQQSKVRYAYAAGQSIVIEDDRNGAYAVLSVVTINGLGDYDVVLIANNGLGNITFGQNYSFGELTDSKVAISDSAPSPALEGDLWWNSDNDELTLYVYYNGAWVPAAPPVSLDGINTTISTALEIQNQILARVDAGEAAQTTLQATVNTALGTQVDIQAQLGTLQTNQANYLPLTGGSLSGQLNTNSLIKTTRNTGYALEVKPDDGSHMAYVHTNGTLYGNVLQIRGDVSNSKRAFELRSKFDNNNGGTDEGYNFFYHYRNTSGPDSLNYRGKQTGDYNLMNHTGINALIEEKIQEYAQSSGGVVPGFSRPPGLKFMYQSGNAVPANGKFTFYSDGGNQRLKISATSQDFAWGTDSPIGDITYSESHLFHIWATTSGGSWKVKVTGSFNRMDWHADNILLYVPYHLTNGTWSDTAAYYITVSGLF